MGVPYNLRYSRPQDATDMSSFNTRGLHICKGCIMSWQKFMNEKPGRKGNDFEL